MVWFFSQSSNPQTAVVFDNFQHTYQKWIEEIFHESEIDSWGIRSDVHDVKQIDVLCYVLYISTPRLDEQLNRENFYAWHKQSTKTIVILLRYGTNFQRFMAHNFFPEGITIIEFAVKDKVIHSVNQQKYVQLKEEILAGRPRPTKTSNQLENINKVDSTQNNIMDILQLHSTLLKEINSKILDQQLFANIILNLQQRIEKLENHLVQQSCNHSIDILGQSENNSSQTQSNNSTALPLQQFPDFQHTTVDLFLCPSSTSPQEIEDSKVKELIRVIFQNISSIDGYERSYKKNFFLIKLTFIFFSQECKDLNSFLSMQQDNIDTFFVIFAPEFSAFRSSQSWEKLTHEAFVSEIVVIAKSLLEF